MKEVLSLLIPVRLTQKTRLGVKLTTLKVFSIPVFRLEQSIY